MTDELLNATARQNYFLTRPLYCQRARLIERIPHFWATVIEEAPEEIDQRIQPRDSAVLGALQNLEVSRFEVSEGGPPVGEPRSVKIRFTFRRNAWFSDRVLEKTFWYRRGKHGWTGLVSEPVQIQWKEGKDLTEGLLDEAAHIFKLENEIKAIQDQGEGGKGINKQINPETLKALTTQHDKAVQNLTDKLEDTPQDALSFFAWFGYRGRNISAEISDDAMKKEKDERAAMRKRMSATRKGIKDATNEPCPTDDRPSSSTMECSETDDASEAEETMLAYEIFSAGEEVALAFTEDLYPGATKYFSMFIPTLRHLNSSGSKTKIHCVAQYMRRFIPESEEYDD